MRFAVLSIALALAACTSSQPPETPQPRQLPVELVGRVAGTPQACVTIVPTQGLRISDSDRHTLLYGSGKTLWANDLGPSCGFGANDILVMQPLNSRYCRGDVARSVDNTSRMPGPTCILGDFVPYTRGR